MPHELSQPGVDVLMSFHGEWIDKVMKGSKTIEVRKRCPRFPPGTRVWMYAVKRDGGVIRGSFVAGEAEAFSTRKPPSAILDGADLRLDELRAYAGDSLQCWAIPVGSPTKLTKPVGIARGPMSYRYLRPDVADDRRLLARLRRR